MSCSATAPAPRSTPARPSAGCATSAAPEEYRAAAGGPRLVGHRRHGRACRTTCRGWPDSSTPRPPHRSRTPTCWPRAGASPTRSSATWTASSSGTPWTAPGCRYRVREDDESPSCSWLKAAPALDAPAWHQQRIRIAAAAPGGRARPGPAPAAPRRPRPLRHQGGQPRRTAPRPGQPHRGPHRLLRPARVRRAPDLLGHLASPPRRSPERPLAANCGPWRPNFVAGTVAAPRGRRPAVRPPAPLPDLLARPPAGHRQAEDGAGTRRRST